MPACLHPTAALATLPPRCPDLSRAAALGPHPAWVCSADGSWWICPLMRISKGKETNQRDVWGLGLNSVPLGLLPWPSSHRHSIRHQTRNRFQTDVLCICVITVLQMFSVSKELFIFDVNKTLFLPLPNPSPEIQLSKKNYPTWISFNYFWILWYGEKRVFGREARLINYILVNYLDERC